MLSEFDACIASLLLSKRKKAQHKNKTITVTEIKNAVFSSLVNI